MTARLFQAVNGPLQARTKVLEADLAAARQFPSDYQTDLESDFARLSKRRSAFSSLVVAVDLLADGDDVERAENLFYQEQVSSRVSKQMSDVVNLLTRALNIHLNLEQQFMLNTSHVFVSLETLKGESLLGKEIQSAGNARLRLPSSGNLSFDEHQLGSLQVRSSSYYLSSSFLCFSSSVNVRTPGFFCVFVEYEFFSSDLLGLDGCTRKWNSSSHRSRSSI